MFLQLLSALEHLQSLGIGHRDISLENIMLDEVEKRYVIIDFGMCAKCRPNPLFGSAYEIRMATAGDGDHVDHTLIREDPGLWHNRFQ